MLDALRRLTLNSPGGEIADLRERAQRGDATGVFEFLASTFSINAERLTRAVFQGSDEAAALARLQGINLSLSIPVLGTALDEMQLKYDVGDPRLAALIANVGGAEMASAEKLIRCLRRFWRQDDEGAAYIGVTLVEGLLRERLLKGGVDPYNLPSSAGQDVGRYKMLGQLLELAEAAGLEESWIAFMKFALVEPLHGMNLRNELAHGAISSVPSAMTAAVIMLAALYLAFAGEGPG